jgi:hypothetical protein
MMVAICMDMEIMAMDSLDWAIMTQGPIQKKYLRKKSSAYIVGRILHILFVLLMISISCLVLVATVLVN